MELLNKQSIVRYVIINVICSRDGIDRTPKTNLKEELCLIINDKTKASAS